MKRVMRSVLALVIAITATMHTVAYARTPVEFYNDVAQCLGLTIDIAEEVWHDKTKAAFLNYLMEDASKVPNPADLYRVCLKLEQVSGYDIVYVSNGKYYIETIGTSGGSGGGGAFYGVPIDWPNYTKAYAEYLKWVRHIVENGPSWPYQGETGGGDGSTVETYTSPMTLYRKFGSKVGVGTTDEITLTMSESQLQTINNVVSGKYSVMFYYAYTNSVDSSSTTGTGYVAYSSKPISITFTKIEGYSVYQMNVQSEGTLRYMQWNPSSSLTTSWTMSSLYNNSNPSTGSFNYVKYLITSGNGAYVPPPTDDTPPERGHDTYINIDWPDITLPSFGLTTTSGPTTAGDIDFTPVTSRLDVINENLMTFTQTFNSFRSDFLEFWEAFGDVLDDIRLRLFNLEGYLRSCRDWLVNIFNKPTGGSNVTMPDPTDFGTGSTGDEGGGFWDWLGKFLDNLIGELPEDVSNFATALGALTGKFPFSVPWDMAYLLGLMSQDPVTPVFDIVQPSVSMQGGQLVYGTENTIHVDLSDYDEDARLLRACIVMAFSLCLAAHTFETLRGMDWAIFE